VLGLLALVCRPGSRLARRTVLKIQFREILIEFEHVDSNLPSFIRLAEIIDIAFAMVVVFTRNDGVHASRFTFERHGCRGISSTALDLHKKRRNERC